MKHKKHFRVRKKHINVLAVVTIILIVFVCLYEVFKISGAINSPSPVNIAQQYKKNSAQIVTNVSSQNLYQDELLKYFTVESVLLGINENVSIYFKDLTNNKEIFIDPTHPWIPASIIKAYVVLEAFREKRLGLLDFNQVVTISGDNVVPTELESNDFPRLREGVQVTVDQLLGAMIEQSDNIAYNTLLDILDRRNINLTLRNYGISQTVVGEKLNLDDNQFQRDLQVLGRQPNTTTAGDYAELFNLLYSNKIPDSAQILDYFKKQKINDMIPALLPFGEMVAHKTGDWAPLYHDGGIIYKKNSPFIFVAFTNGNDPSVVAKLAKIAYFQSPDVVGQKAASGISRLALQKSLLKNQYFIADDFVNNAVLGVTNGEKFPKITASDLGITVADLTNNSAVQQKILDAKIAPDSILYGLKRFAETIASIIPKNGDSKIDEDIARSNARIAEVKVLFKKGDTVGADKLLTESEVDLKHAADSSASSKKKDEKLVEVKQASDLHFATLGNVSEILDQKSKKEFIDSVYKLHIKNKEEIKPLVATSSVVSSIAQEPTIGTVKELKGKNVVVQFDDGSKKTVVTNDSTPSKDFHQDNSTKVDYQVGSKIAIIVQSSTRDTIIPQFILKNVPKELPDRRNGTILKINPATNSMIIIDQNGQRVNISVDKNTLIKSKDTNVTLDGIKAGSTVSVFGEPGDQNKGSMSSQPASKSAAQTNNANYSKNEKNSISSPSQKVENKIDTNKSTNFETNIRATTITITQNSNGKVEKTTTSSSSKNNGKTQNKNSQKPSAPPPSTSQVKKDEKKPDNTPKK